MLKENPKVSMNIRLWASGLATACAMVAATSTLAQPPAPAKPIACAADLLTPAQRQTVAMTATAEKITQAEDTASRRILLDAVERCPNFARMKDEQLTLAADYAEASAVLTLAEKRLAALEAAPGLVDKVWRAFSDEHRAALIKFEAEDVEPSDAMGQQMVSIMFRVGVTQPMVDAVAMGLEARVKMTILESQW